MSGGIFRDMTIHDFDMARFILGEEPEIVFATGSRLVDPRLMEKLGDYDTVTVVMTTASGKQAVITNSREAVYGYDQRVEAFGSKGMAMSENRRPHQMLIVRQRVQQSRRAAPELFHRALPGGVRRGRSTPSSRRSRRQRPPVVGFEDGRRALALAEAALKSVAEGRAVKVSEVG